MNSILTTKPSKDYALLDSGENQKLERFGDTVLSRPDPQALWAKNVPTIWQKADGVFLPDSKEPKESKVESSWKFDSEAPEKWQIELANLHFWIKPAAFKHVGVFPEQVSNWNWVREVIKNKKGNEKISVLNLFGYTGGATLAAAQAGAEVCHVDGSKTAIAWARENAKISGLEERPIRWILDDVTTYVKREVKRGNKYDGIIMDPPIFGRGPNGEIWKIEEHLLPLIESCGQIMKEAPLFFLINGYAAGYSAIALENILNNLTLKWGGSVEAGELTIEEEKTGRLLPAGIFGRWKK